jgi:hypothetical protein
MPAFCAKCGSPLGSSTGFCPACGTPITAEAPVAAPAVPVLPMAAAAPVYAVPAAVPPYAQAPPQKSSSALKIILIIVLVLVGVGLLGAGVVGFFAWRVAKSVHMDANGNNATVSIPGVGTMSAGDSTASDADLGVPAYPGATREKGGMNLNSGSATMVMAHFSTADSQSQVVDFYKSKMGDGAVAVATGNGTAINSGGQDTNRIMVTVGPGSGDDAGKTTIIIMHTQKKTGE